MNNDDDEEALCCCEFISSSGERRHLLQLCCDCAELDDAVDRIVSGRGVPDGRTDKVLDCNFVMYMDTLRNSLNSCQ